MNVNKILLLWAGVMMWLIPAIGQTTEFPYPTVDYSADMTMRVQQENNAQPYVINGTIRSTRQSERREVDHLGSKTIVIKHRDNDETWLLMPALKAYQIDKGEGRQKDPQQMIRDGELKLTRQASEMINGISAIRYRVSSEGSSKEQFNGFAWLTKQNIPVRFQGKIHGAASSYDIRIDYTRIKIGRQNPKLFQIPSDYRSISGRANSKKARQSVQMHQEMNRETLERYRKQMEAIMKQRPDQ